MGDSPPFFVNLLSAVLSMTTACRRLTRKDRGRQWKLSAQGCQGSAQSTGRGACRIR